MSGPRITRIVPLVVAGVLFGGVARLAPWIEDERERLQINWVEQAELPMSPDVAITKAALGTFRGLAVNFLWLRALRLEGAGRLHEAMQLSRWITRLQPRFARVWDFQAFNMAYNISRATHTPAERWAWVRAGIRLLRDEAIPHNPENLRLYKELGWLFFHKIGEYYDPMHEYYKRRLALQWHQLLGEPPAGGVEEHVEWLVEYEQAPLTVEALLLQSPRLRPVVDDLQAQEQTFDEELLVRLLADGRVPDALPPGKESLEIREELLTFLRAGLLRSRFRMDPSIMIELVRQVGPLDWRHPAAHAIYWAHVGLQRNERGLDPLARTSWEASSTDGLIFAALRKLVRDGRVVLEPDSGYFTMLPDTRFLVFLERMLRALAVKAGELDTQEFHERHRNFLEFAAGATYASGEIQSAEGFFEKLRAGYGDATPGQTAEDLALEVLTRELRGPQDAQVLIERLLFQSLREAESADVGASERLARLARRVHDWWQAYVESAEKEHDGHSHDHGHNGHNHLNLEAEGSLPPFDDLRDTARDLWQAKPPEARHQLHRGRVPVGSP